MNPNDNNQPSTSATLTPAEQNFLNDESKLIDTEILDLKKLTEQKATELAKENNLSIENVTKAIKLWEKIASNKSKKAVVETLTNIWKTAMLYYYDYLRNYLRIPAAFLNTLKNMQIIVNEDKEKDWISEWLSNILIYKDKSVLKKLINYNTLSSIEYLCEAALIVQDIYNNEKHLSEADILFISEVCFKTAKLCLNFFSFDNKPSLKKIDTICTAIWKSLDFISIAAYEIYEKVPNNLLPTAILKALQLYDLNLYVKESSNFLQELIVVTKAKLLEKEAKNKINDSSLVERDNEGIPEHIILNMDDEASAISSDYSSNTSTSTIMSSEFERDNEGIPEHIILNMDDEASAISSDYSLNTSTSIIMPSEVAPTNMDKYATLVKQDTSSISKTALLKKDKIEKKLVEEELEEELEEAQTKL